MQLDKAMGELSDEYSAYQATVARWIEEKKRSAPQFSAEVEELEAALQTMQAKEK